MSNEASVGRSREGAAVQSVDRAVTVLEILAREREAGVTEIAVELGVHKSTAFRLISVLEQRGLVEQNVDRGKYRLGVGILRLAGATAGRLEVTEQSRPVTSELALEVGETVNIALLSGPDALYVDQVAGTSAMQTRNWVGQRIPLHATSNGKALLAHLSTADRAALLTGPLEKFTRRTITSVRKLEAELAEVRRLGYASTAEELEEGLVAVAAPIRDMAGDVVASVSVSGPVYRFPKERVPELGVTVRAAADEISRRMGWTGGER
jgi:DNA-binding IclR family transcriptional regulator